MLTLQVAELLLLMVVSAQSANFPGLLVLAVGKLLGLLINVLFWAVIIQAILSWVNPDPRNPAISLLYQLTEPILRPARRLVPPISGLDLSPILVLVALQLLKLLLVAPLEDIGFAML
jgi:YggT family protein